MPQNGYIAQCSDGDWLPWEPNPHERIMILAPHPDDEVLAAGGVIASVLKSGNPSEIRVIIVTNGDASYSTAFFHSPHLVTQKNFQRQAVLRQQESLNALTLLGLDKMQVRFWGFPDRGLAALWKNHRDTQAPYRSSTTGFDTSVQALNSPVLPYTGADLDQLFGKELLEFRPTLIIMPHPQDNHSDHSALAGFTFRAVRQHYVDTHLPPPVLFAYWMWRETKPWLMRARPHRLDRFWVEANPSSKDGRCFILKPDVQEQKVRALQCYPSQKISAGRLFREASSRKYEAFVLLHLAL